MSKRTVTRVISSIVAAAALAFGATAPAAHAAPAGKGVKHSVQYKDTGWD